MAQHNDLGHWGEQKVAEYLQDKGWYIRHIDWKYKHLDIDIVAIDANRSIVRFVEVKTRSSNIWGEPDQAITLEKKNNILKAASAYTRLYRLDNCEIYFDTASVIGTIDNLDFTIDYKKDAFNSFDSFYYYEQRRKQAYYKRKKVLGGRIA